MLGGFAEDPRATADFRSEAVGADGVDTTGEDRVENAGLAPCGIGGDFSGGMQAGDFCADAGAAG